MRYVERQAKWVELRETDGSENWENPRKIEEMLRDAVTYKSKVIQFIDQSARQLASTKSKRTPLKVVTGLYHKAEEGGISARYSMQEYADTRPNVFMLLRSHHGPPIKSTEHLSPVIQWAGCLDGNDSGLPQAIVGSDTTILVGRLLPQMQESEWKEEWLPSDT